MRNAKSVEAEKPSVSSAEGTALFPMPETPLGDACKQFVTITQEIAEKKVARDEQKKVVLAEMKKEGRMSLTVTVGNDNWTFEIKESEEDLRCVKATRQPQPKTVTVEEN